MIEAISRIPSLSKTSADCRKTQTDRFLYKRFPPVSIRLLADPTDTYRQDTPLELPWSHLLPMSIVLDRFATVDTHRYKFASDIAASHRSLNPSQIAES